MQSRVLIDYALLSILQAELFDPLLITADPLTPIRLIDQHVIDINNCSLTGVRLQKRQSAHPLLTPEWCIEPCTDDEGHLPQPSTTATLGRTSDTTTAGPSEVRMFISIICALCAP